jgi:hypothetical protein
MGQPDAQLFLTLAGLRVAQILARFLPYQSEEA